jgi:hypothetical protein
MNLPSFTPERVDTIDQKVQLVGQVSSKVCIGQNWIGERWIGYIGRDEEAPVEGRWFAEDERWRFTSENPKAADFQVGQRLQLYDGYWGERAYIVLAPMAWTEAQFEAKKEWDHDHCGICWATICSEAPTHFQSSERNVVCPNCYEKYVQLRSLSFIQPTQNKRMESNG